MAEMQVHGGPEDVQTAPPDAAEASLPAHEAAAGQDMPWQAEDPGDDDGAAAWADPGPDPHSMASVPVAGACIWICH